MGSDLWRKYCSFYDKPFHQQMEQNRRTTEEYFSKWKTTDFARMMQRKRVQTFKETLITTYGDYPMLTELGGRVADAVERNARKPGELFKEYYDRISREIGSSLDRYMAEPFHLCMKTTGTTGESKWIAHGETFWRNFVDVTGIANFVIACSDTWGETKLEIGDGFLNVGAPIPYMSGYGVWAVSQAGFRCVPPIEITDNLRDMRERMLLMLKAVRREKIAAGGGVGAMFYMICQYLIEPGEFYQEYYRSMDFGLRKMLLYAKLLQIRLSRKEVRKITDFMPLKGVVVAGMESRLYLDFFKREFDLEPLHIYGTTEAGSLMRGDPDRKADLVPDLRTSRLEFKTEEGDMKDLDELKRGEIYELVVTPFGSIIFRYNMEDLFRVVDFRDDGMPIFEFEGRRITVIDIYGYRLSPNVVVRALHKAGLKSSDKWALVKLVKPREHLHFLMEKTWQHTEREAEGMIFQSIAETERMMPHRGKTFADYVDDFRIRDPSEAVKVEYLRPGAFLRYSMIKGREGVPIGQYKPPRIIPSEKMDIYDTLRSA